MAIDGLAQMITVLASLFHKGIRGIIYTSTYVDELKKLNGLEPLKQTMYDQTLTNRTERNKD